MAEYDGSGTLLRRHVHGEGADEPVATYEGAALGPAARTYYLEDHQGSLIARLRADTGAPVNLNTYDEYGTPGPGNQGRFQYTGQAWLPELGLYYYKARMYSPFHGGRFLQVDPVGYEDGANLYGYARGDPVNRTDPSGTQSISDMQLQAQIEDLRLQGYAEEEIRSILTKQAETQASALILLMGGADLLALRGLWAAARGAGFSAAVKQALGMPLAFSMASRQFGHKWASHAADFGLDVRSTADRTKFANMVMDIAKNPERVVNGTFRGQGAGGGRGPVQFRIKGSDVVITTRKGEFVTILKNGIDNPSVQNALKRSCTGSLIKRITCD